MTTTDIEQLTAFKSFYPDLEYVQSLTIEHVHEFAQGNPIDWNRLRPVDLVVRDTSDIDPCLRAVGTALWDCISLGAGAWGLYRMKYPAQAAQDIAVAVRPILPKIERLLAQVVSGETLQKKADAIRQILSAIYTGGCLSAVWKAFTANLTWWQMAIYGISGIATISAMVLTSGAAFVAETVIVLGTVGQLIIDANAAVTTCRVPPTPYTPDPGPSVPESNAYGPNMAIRTTTGNFITIVDNGGIGTSNNIMQADRTVVGPWERFTVIPIDMTAQTFALKTMTGNYVTAVNGGGCSGPNDATHPIHTDATAIGPWETLTFVTQDEDDAGNLIVSINTQTGFYLTALDGGGHGGPNDNNSPIHTDASVLGPWETFTFVSLV